jgi:hypothetical protein
MASSKKWDKFIRKSLFFMFMPTQKDGDLEKKVGYEVAFAVGDGMEYVFCVDGERKIRSWYSEEGRNYFSDWERWVDHNGFGTIKGELCVGGYVTAYDECEDIFTCNGYKVKDCLVTRLEEADIDKMTEHQTIAGLDYTISEYEN